MYILNIVDLGAERRHRPADTGRYDCNGEEVRLAAHV